MKQTAVEWLEIQLFKKQGKFNKSDIDQAKAMEKEQSIHKLFVGFQEWHKNEYGSKYVEIDRFNEYLETYKRIKTD